VDFLREIVSSSKLLKVYVNRDEYIDWESVKEAGKD